jgi:hypothetical protein
LLGEERKLKMSKRKRKKMEKLKKANASEYEI